MAQWNAASNLYIETCCICGSRFGLAEEVHDVAVARRDDFVFFCPNGHGQIYGKDSKEEENKRPEIMQGMGPANIIMLREPSTKENDK